jgi:hypothetical protein
MIRKNVKIEKKHKGFEMRYPWERKDGMLKEEEVPHDNGNLFFRHGFLEGWDVGRDGVRR